jgi:hypothetical protein
MGRVFRAGGVNGNAMSAKRKKRKARTADRLDTKPNAER